MAKKAAKKVLPPVRAKFWKTKHSKQPWRFELEQGHVDMRPKDHYGSRRACRMGIFRKLNAELVAGKWKTPDGREVVLEFLPKAPK